MNVDKKNPKVTLADTDPAPWLDLGSWLGRHQAFGLVANRCGAAQAECLKAIRQSGEYKRLGLNWDEFCEQKAGISRRHADRLISHLEEFGTNYFRLAELIQVPVETYRLISSAVSEEGVDLDGQKIPLKPENRERVKAAVRVLSQKASATLKDISGAGSVQRKLDAVLETVRKNPPNGMQRAALIGVLEEGAEKLSDLSRDLRRSLLVVS